MDCLAVAHHLRIPSIIIGSIIDTLQYCVYDVNKEVHHEGREG